MKLNKLAIALLAIFSWSPVWAAPDGSMSRAQVQAEYLEAKATGSLNSVGESYDGTHYFVSTRSRAEVLAELRTAYVRGEVTQGENYPVFKEAELGRTRAEVKEELRIARLNHERFTSDDGHF